MTFKRWIAGLVLGFGVILSAQALLPLAAAVVWLGGVVTANASLATAVEASIYVHAGIFAAYELFFAQKDASGNASGTPPLTVILNPSAARTNPDPTKFDDPAAGARDVTPKASATGTQTSVNTPAGQTVPTTIYCGDNNVCATSIAGYCAGQPPHASSFNGQSGSTSYQMGADGHCHAIFKFDSSSSTVDLGALSDPKKSTANTTSCPGISLVASAGKCPASNFPETGPVTCPAGYATSTGTTCTLIDATAVKKPDTQPCEILRATTGMQLDAANPNCAQSGIQVQGNSVQLDSQSISINADGSISVATPTGQTTFQIGSYNSDGSVNITGVSRSGNPGAYVPSATSGSGSGTGTGTSTGTTTAPSCGGVGQAACSSGSGTGGSSCGAPGQPACTIDDSGFAGKTVSTADGVAGLDSYNAQRSDLLNTIKGSVTTPDFGWQLPVQSIACQPLQFGFFKGMQFQWNWCPYIPVIQQAMSFLAYCFTALYLFGLLYGNKQEGK